jgi:hypothetical protein
MSVDPQPRERARPLAVLGRAFDIARRHRARVLVGALACLVAPAVGAALLAELVLGDELPAVLTALVGLAMTVLSAGGVVVFVGYLDLVVHRDWHGETVGSLGEVVLRLPLRRLLAADVLLVTMVAVGSAFLLVPGLVVMTWYGLVGSMIVTGGATSVRDGFALSRRIVRGHFLLVFSMVTVPLIIEHDIVLFAEHAIEDSSDLTGILVGIVIILLVNVTVALVEVVLAGDLRRELSAAPAAG